MVCIYGLYDPRYPDIIRYVGKTICDLKVRLQAHIDQRYHRTHKCIWIRKLIREGIRPSILLIEKVNEENWKEREKYWISLLKEENRLTNTTGGGDSGNPSIFSKIISYTLDGQLYKIYDSVQNACRELNYSRGKINSALQRKGKGGSYLWRYYKENYENNISPYTDPYSCKIKCLDLKENRNYEFKSIKEFLENFNLKPCGNVNRCLNIKSAYKKRFLIERIN